MQTKSSLIRLIVAALFIFIPQVSSSDVAFENDPLVKIKILSRQVRLLREGKINQIALLVQNNSVLYDEANIEIIKCKKIIFSYTEGKWHSGCSQEAQKNCDNDNEKFTFKISGATSDDHCLIKLDGEERKYPLPFEAVCDPAGLRFYTYERLNRYAIDSACAEYESPQWKEREGILALAHIIKARYHYAKKSPQHNDSDFCDLTHCQVYRGKSGSGIILDDDWEIDYENLKHNLFFHSRCGGYTYDDSIFSIQKDNSASEGFAGVRDWLFRTGVRLCAGKDSSWSRSISVNGLAAIIFDKEMSGGRLSDFSITRKDGVIIINNNTALNYFSPETLRLKINRVKGWNFLKSNHYTLSEEIIKDKKIFRFTGEGLGHGVGLCQHGALALSGMGYNRYEIIEHYFQNIPLKKQKNKTASLPPYLSYYIFNLSDGTSLAQNPGYFLKRNIPPGSVFKLFVSLYLAKERQDIFSSYRYFCANGNNDSTMPDRCWKPDGHGKMSILEAIPNSCNLYFASLYNKISFKDFKIFFVKFCKKIDMRANLPEINSSKEWSRLLAGLDYKISFSIDDYVRLVCFLNPSSKDDYLFITPEQKTIIFNSLKDTFINGTASGNVKPYGSPKNYDGLEEVFKKIKGGSQHDFWGKTATIIDGTNKPKSYGLFIGGCGNTGIVALLREGNGNLAARWAQFLLSNEHID